MLSVLQGEMEALKLRDEVQLGRTKFGKLGVDVSELVVSVAVEGCTVEPEREVLEWDASIASSYHRVLIPPDCAARAFACRARVEAQGKTVFDAAFAVQRSSAAALSGPCSPTAPSVSLQGSACSTSSSSSSSSSWSSDTSRALGSPPKTTQLLLFACSPHVSPLPQAGSEAVEVALATSWGELGDAVRISFGGDAERLRASLKEARVRRFLFSGHADAKVPSGGGERSLGFTKPGGELETVPPQTLAELLGEHAVGHGGALELVFLNGCNSDSLGRAVHAAGVPHVVCWQTQCADGAARIFARTFFQASAQGCTYEQAFEEAKRGVLGTTRRAAASGGPRVPMYELRARHTPPQQSFLHPSPIAAGIPVLLPVA